MTSKPIIIGYDGSESARHAIAFGGELFTGRDAIVVTAFEDWPPVAAGDRTPSPSIDAARRAKVEQLAAEGADLAISAGFKAVAQVEFASHKPWRTLVEAADEHDAALILVGSHGFGGVRALALGSVSHALVHHAHQPVLAVPAPATAAARREHRAERTAA